MSKYIHLSLHAQEEHFSMSNYIHLSLHAQEEQVKDKLGAEGGEAEALALGRSTSIGMSHGSICFPMRRRSKWRTSWARRGSPFLLAASF
jgi:hypothetical protein